MLFVAAGALVLLTRRADHSPTPPPAPHEASQGPILKDVGPRLLSNQTAQPITVYGERLPTGAKLKLGAPLNREIPLVVADPNHAFGRLPSDLDLPKDQIQADIPCTIDGAEGTAKFTLVNDRAYPDFFAMTATSDGTRFVISPTTDTLYVQGVDGGTESASTNDGPYALATEKTDAGERVWIAHRFSPSLVAFEGTQRVSEVPAPTNAASLVIDSDKHIAYVAEQARDTVSALDLSQNGRELWRTPVAPNPGPIALAGKFLAVGSQETGELELIDLATGKAEPAFAPEPGLPILGGGTAGFSNRVMGGTAPRAMVHLRSKNVLLISSIGPDIGPNPEKMEVSMNGGVSVVDLTARKFVRHLGFGAGISEGLAVDEKKGRLYAADIGTGLVRELDLKALLKDDKSAAKAVLAEIAIPPPDGFPLARAEADYGVNGRSGKELHSGPRAIALNGTQLSVLNRHTGTVTSFSTSGKELSLAQSTTSTVGDRGQQATRRLGEVLYYADMGRTAMSCDACHVEGHTGGLLFAKTMPLRIYRSPTIRGSRETPPYFIPASTFSLAETAKVVGSRNRFHNPNLTDREVEALAAYSAAITLLPNPFRKADGSFAETLDLPDGHRGHPLAGMKLFEKQGCTSCHPPPTYTTDQDAATRGKHLDVGTPHLMPLRSELQDATFKGFPPPSLLGNWDIWPQLTTGLAGLEPTADGRTLQVNNRYATRVVLEHYSGPQHGNAQALTPEERDDLLAFLMSL